MGPLPFFQLEKTVGIVVAGLVIHGFGLGAEVVAGFADAHKSVRKRLRGNRRRSSDSPLLTAKIEFSAFLGHCQWVSWHNWHLWIGVWFVDFNICFGSLYWAYDGRNLVWQRWLSLGNLGDHWHPLFGHTFPHHFHSLWKKVSSFWMTFWSISLVLDNTQKWFAAKINPLSLSFQDFLKLLKLA